MLLVFILVSYLRVVERASFAFVEWRCLICLDHVIGNYHVFVQPLPFFCDDCCIVFLGCCPLNGGGFLTRENGCVGEKIVSVI